MPMFDPRFGFGLNPAELSKYNASHTVRSLTFGPAFPGQLSPLNGVTSEPTERPAMYQHYIKIVPTVYEHLDGTLVDSNQFSASDFAIQLAPAEGVIVQPGVWFRYAPSLCLLVRQGRHALRPAAVTDMTSAQSWFASWRRASRSRSFLSTSVPFSAACLLSPE